jgi:SAM-dependent methyltransferase
MQHSKIDTGLSVEAIYSKRFSVPELKARDATWKVLCSEFLSKFISPEETVLDIGAGDGFFLKYINAKRRIAVDFSPHVNKLKLFGIEVIQEEATAFAEKVEGPVDVVFASNFFEHLSNKEEVFSVLRECFSVLKPNGRIIILQPNIKYVGNRYWDYIDHHIALTENSLAEALEAVGFRVDTVIAQFLPYTAKSFLGRFSGLVSLYLKIPILWRIFGKQSFIVATKL